ncbi:phytoene dehydrogenase [Aspergillus floccosus]
MHRDLSKASDVLFRESCMVASQLIIFQEFPKDWSACAGGIATATRLSCAGYRVHVLEKNDYIGGRCSLLFKDGHRFDQGPSLMLMPELFRHAFDDLGTSMEQEDGNSVKLSRDLTSLKAHIEQHEGPGGFSRFCAFLSEAGFHVLSMFHFSLVKAMLHIRPWTSTYTNASKYFRSEKMRQVWTFASMYVGMSPYKSPGTYSFLPFIEMRDGIWYPMGGFEKILQALADIGRRSGAEYHLKSPVSRVQLSDQGNAATGVRLASGEVLRADLVVVNADLVYAYSHLLPPSQYGRRLQLRSTSCSSLSFFWGFSEAIPELQPYNVFLAERYRESFDALFDENRTSDDFSFYVNVPSRIDSTAAPDGKESVMVLVPVAHLENEGHSERVSWESLVAHIRYIVIKTIEARTGAFDLQSKLKEKFNLDRGAILGLSHSFSNALWFCPQIEHQSIKNLYFVGCNTHPGAGVPSALVSGKLVSEQILRNEMSQRERVVHRGRRLSFITSFFVLVTACFLLGLS